VTEKFALVPFSYGALLRASSAEAEDERDVPFTYIEETSWESTDHG